MSRTQNLNLIYTTAGDQHNDRDSELISCSAQKKLLLAAVLRARPQRWGNTIGQHGVIEQQASSVNSYTSYLNLRLKINTNILFEKKLIYFIRHIIF